MTGALLLLSFSPSLSRLLLRLSVLLSFSYHLHQAQKRNMADTASHPPPERTDFQELEDAEDLFSDPAVTQEVRWRTGFKGGQGELW